MSEAARSQHAPQVWDSHLLLVDMCEFGALSKVGFLSFRESSKKCHNTQIFQNHEFEATT
jgi:hypothetical protein